MRISSRLKYGERLMLRTVPVCFDGERVPAHVAVEIPGGRLAPRRD